MNIWSYRAKILPYLFKSFFPLLMYNLSFLIEISKEFKMKAPIKTSKHVDISLPGIQQLAWCSLAHAKKFLHTAEYSILSGASSKPKHSKI